MDAKQFLAEFGHIANAPNGVQLLREMILSLAVKGKLATHHVNDTPVNFSLSSLSKRRTEVLSLYSLTETRKHKNLGKAIGSFHVPSHWGWEFLAYVSSWPLKDGDWVESKDQTPSGNVRLIQLADIGVGEYKNKSARFLTEKRAIELNCYFLKEGDVLIARLPAPLGRACIFPGDDKQCVTVVDVAVCRAEKEFIEPNYLVHCINSLNIQSQVEEIGTGTTRKRVATGKLGLLTIPIPPIQEQYRIVAKVDELMALCDKLETQQQQKRKLQNQLRQATLQAVANAESPKALQDSWERLADNFSHVFAKPADVLTARQLIKKLAISGFLIVEKETPLSSIELSQKSSIPWQVPSTWNWLQTTKLGDSRLGKMLDKSKNTGELRPYLRNVNVRWGKFDLTSLLEMKVEDEELDRVSVKKGDLVICEGGEPGRAAIWNSDEKFVIQKALHRFRCYKEIITAEYLLLCLEHDFYSGRLVEFYTGATIKHLTGKSLAKYSVPVPPLKQQKKIVKRVNELMQYCDTLENQLRSANKTAENLATAAISSLTGITTQQQEEPMKAPKTELKAPVRLGETQPSKNNQAPLATLLTRHNGELSANDLWQRFGGEIDAFYAQLKTEVRKGWIAEPFDNDDGKTKPHHVILEKEAD